MQGKSRTLPTVSHPALPNRLLQKTLMRQCYVYASVSIPVPVSVSMFVFMSIIVSVFASVSRLVFVSVFLSVPALHLGQCRCQPVCLSICVSVVSLGVRVNLNPSVYVMCVFEFQSMRAARYMLLPLLQCELACGRNSLRWRRQTPWNGVSECRYWLAPCGSAHVH